MFECNLQDSILDFYLFSVNRKSNLQCVLKTASLADNAAFFHVNKTIPLRHLFVMFKNVEVHSMGIKINKNYFVLGSCLLFSAYQWKLMMVIAFIVAGDMMISVDRPSSSGRSHRSTASHEAGERQRTAPQDGTI